MGKVEKFLFVIYELEMLRELEILALSFRMHAGCIGQPEMCRILPPRKPNMPSRLERSRVFLAAISRAVRTTIT